VKSRTLDKKFSDFDSWHFVWLSPLLLGIAFFGPVITPLFSQYLFLQNLISIIAFIGLLISIPHLPKKGRDDVYHDSHGHRVRKYMVYVLYTVSIAGVSLYFAEQINSNYNMLSNLVTNQQLLLMSFISNVVGFIFKHA